MATHHDCLCNRKQKKKGQNARETKIHISLLYNVFSSFELTSIKNERGSLNTNIHTRPNRTEPIRIQYFNGLLFSVIYCVCYYLFSYVLLIFAPFLHVFGACSLSFSLIQSESICYVCPFCVSFALCPAVFECSLGCLCVPLVCDLFSFLYLGKQISFSV